MRGPGREHLFRKCRTGEHMLPHQVWKFAEEAFDGVPARQIFENDLNGLAQPAHARLAAAVG